MTMRIHNFLEPAFGHLLESVRNFFDLKGRKEEDHEKSKEEVVLDEIQIMKDIIEKKLDTPYFSEMKRKKKKFTLVCQMVFDVFFIVVLLTVCVIVLVVGYIDVVKERIKPMTNSNVRQIDYSHWSCPSFIVCPMSAFETSQDQTKRERMWMSDFSLKFYGEHPFGAHILMNGSDFSINYSLRLDDNSTVLTNVSCWITKADQTSIQTEIFNTSDTVKLFWTIEFKVNVTYKDENEYLLYEKSPPRLMFQVFNISQELEEMHIDEASFDKLDDAKRLEIYLAALRGSDFSDLMTTFNTLQYSNQKSRVTNSNYRYPLSGKPSKFLFDADFTYLGVTNTCDEENFHCQYDAKIELGFSNLVQEITEYADNTLCVFHPADGNLFSLTSFFRFTPFMDLGSVIAIMTTVFIVGTIVIVLFAGTCFTVLRWCSKICKCGKTQGNLSDDLIRSHVSLNNDPETGKRRTSDLKKPFIGKE